MQGVGMIGGKRERALAADLRVQMPAGPQMLQALVVQLGWGERAEAWQARPGLRLGGVALATFHRSTPELITSEEPRISRSLSSGAPSRDPLAQSGLQDGRPRGYRPLAFRHLAKSTSVCSSVAG